MKTTKSAADLAGIEAGDVLFFMACGDKKIAATEPVSLIDLYDGPTWQTFRTYRAEAILASHVVILSGKFGWTSGLCDAVPYNERISSQKVDRLIEHGACEQERNSKGTPIGWTPAQLVSRPDNCAPWKAVVICGGAEYRRAFFAVLPELIALGYISATAPIFVTEGGIGEQRGQLGEALRALSDDEEAPAPFVPVAITAPAQQLAFGF